MSFAKSILLLLRITRISLCIKVSSNTKTEVYNIKASHNFIHHCIFLFLLNSSYFYNRCKENIFSWFSKKEIKTQIYVKYLIYICEISKYRYRFAHILSNRSKHRSLSFFEGKTQLALLG